MKKFLDEKVISRLEGLELKARLVVEGGIISGLHKSGRHGANIEFSDYREYLPGDELKYIDWKVYGRRDKFYVKEHEEETNLKAYIMLDNSSSMGYKGEGISKLEYGGLLAASLAYLMLNQQDYVGFITFSEGINSFLPPRGNRTYIHEILKQLENLNVAGKTDIKKTLQEFTERIKRRGLIIVISDLFGEQEEILRSLKHLRHKKHEVIVFHILTEYELFLPYDGLFLFKDLEDGSSIKIEPSRLRKEYIKCINNFIEGYRNGCLQEDIDYLLIPTSLPLERTLVHYLVKRKRR